MRALLVSLLLVLPLLAGCLSQAPETPDAAPEGPVETAPGPIQVKVRWTPAEPMAGKAVFFDVETDDPADPVTDASWDFGDGTGERGVQPTHTYRYAGNYTLQVQAETRSGADAKINTQIQVGADPGTPTPSNETSEPISAPTILWNLTQNHLQATFAWDRAPTAVLWSFGDGTTTETPKADHQYVTVGEYTLSLTLWDGPLFASNRTTVEVTETPFLPHVIIGIPDTGINPYHEMYYRPRLDAHPCTYIEGYPCDIPALELTLDPSLDLSFQERRDQDLSKWQAIRPGDVFWIPRTVFIGAICEEPYDGGATDPGGLDGSICILDDSHMHGTGTTSSALMENPEALFVFKEGGSSVGPILESGIPVDVLSVSWGSIVPIPILGYSAQTPFYVTSAGNDPRTTILDDKGDPDVISVGGAFAEDNTQELLAGNQAEVVSYFCRPTAQTRSLDEMRDSYCGTSFSAPTVAGALSKVILRLRQESGYTGGIQGHVVDKIQGITKDDIRQAMRHTASYDPESQYPNTDLLAAPLNPVAPYLQWGWGFYDGLVAEDTLAYLAGTLDSNKDDLAVTYLETLDLVQDLAHP